jgi:PIN domain nuclease of toxin-antitoxin system
MKTYVLDACALIAYINDEKGAGAVSALFSEKKRVFVSMIIMNLMKSKRKNPLIFIG